MTTTLDIVDRALEICQIKALGVASTAEDSNLGLRVLTTLLDSWQLDPHAIIGLTELVFTPAAGAQTVTIGTAGNIATTMPVRIDASSFVRLSGSDYPLRFAASWDEYTSKSPKDTQGFQTSAFWMPKNTGLGTLYLYPASNGGELHLWVEQGPINGFASLTLATSLTLPAGYRQALEDTLADRLALDYGVDPLTAGRLKIQAAISLRKLKRVNARVPQLSVCYGAQYDATSDTYQ